ncbi:MAG: hypothetical protein PHP96_01895 [Candidatus Dojkabacteria bacterium]|nr:hypothetical protein [Candidatus Dojkabacteria bacterium]
MEVHSSFVEREAIIPVFLVFVLIGELRPKNYNLPPSRDFFYQSLVLARILSWNSEVEPREIKTKLFDL